VQEQAGGDRPISLVEDAYSSLLSAIAEARLGPGTPLSQNKLAAHLGVSRTPVREALLRLERDGLVQRTPDVGFVVAAITPEEVDEACDLLEVLDTFVYLRAAKVLAAEQLGVLLALAAQLVEHAEAGDAEAWKDADRRYHALVMQAADNRFVAEYLQQLRRRVQRFWLAKPHFDGRLRGCSQDHVALAQAMIDQDDTVVAQCIHSHIERLRRNVLDRLESAGSLLPGSDPLAGVTPRPAPPTPAP
jgi:DNA-binding GntR family transcriptional regulator